MHPVLRLYNKLSRWPLGSWMFSKAVCFKAPYFASIKPLFVELAPGRSVVKVRKRRAVSNHIGTVHAIAMANACELAAGTLTEVSLPKTLRWIPKGMTIHYQRKAATDILATALIDTEFTDTTTMDLVVPVSVTDANGQEVVRADITMYVSPKPQ